MPMQSVLAIEYTREAATATMSPFQASRKALQWNLDRAWDLGADAIPVEKTEEMDEYWQRIRAEVQKMPKLADEQRLITHVMLTG